MIPSGILNPKCVSVVGHGVVLDPSVFKSEIVALQKSGIEVSEKNLKISQNCTVITSYNKLLDGARESKGKTKIGTTGKGIGPSYEDKISRRAIKVIDLLDRDRLKSRLEENFMEKEILFKHLYEVSFPTIDEEVDRLFELGKYLTPFVADTFGILDKALINGKKILYEGAQGILLDIDYGTYPFVTSSNTSFGGIYTGAGVPGKQIDEVIGIVKAYTTRVGEGPFPTELFSEVGVQIQTIGGEFGATTGRTRRCGWLDLPMLKYSIKVGKMTSITLTKLDVLTEINELKVCYAYEYEGKEIDCAYPGLDMSKVKPLYREMTPFKDSFRGDNLSKELNDYVSLIEEVTGVAVDIIAYSKRILLKKISYRSFYMLRLVRCKY